MRFGVPATNLQIFLQKRPWFFDLLFWTPFWLIPDLSLPSITVIIAAKNAVMGVAFSILLSALANVCARAWRRYFYLVVGMLLWIGAAIFIAYTVMGHAVINTLGLFDVGQYTYVGLRPFTWISGEESLLPWLVALCFPLAILAWQWRRLDMPVKRFYLAALCVALLLPIPFEVANCAIIGECGAGNFTPKIANLDHYPPAATYVTLIQVLQLRTALASQVKVPPPTIRADHKPLTLVVVVGESTNRSHMSLYGYCRPTTPNLDALAPQSYIFRDVLSPVPLTTLAVPTATTLRVGGASPSSFPLPQVLNLGGFTTYWISNQWNNFSPSDEITKVSSTAKHVVLLNGDENLSQSERDPLDSDLLAPYKNALGEPAAKKAIFLHMIGGHITYTDRYPAGYLPQGLQPVIKGRSDFQAATINDYDRAIHYDDDLLGQMIAQLQHDGGDAALVFFSDHGEEIFDQIDWHGHTNPGTRAMVEPPLVVWLSPSLRLHRPDLAQALAASVDKRMQIKDIPALLTEIAGVQVTGLPGERLPLSSTFRPETRLSDGRNYDADRNLGTKAELPPLCAEKAAAAP